MPAHGDESTAPIPINGLEIEQPHQRLAGIAAQVAAGIGPAPADLTTEPIDATHQLDAAQAPVLSARRSAQGLAAMAARDIGRVREINQDSVFALLTTLPREGSDLSVGLFIVADGMGGHQGGEVASRLAVRTVVHQVLSQLVLPALDDSMSTALQPLMVSAVQAANQAIWEAAQAMGTDMGTTCTAVLMVGHGLYIAHVGDSRAYLYEPGGLRQITNDHSTVGRLIQLGQLDPSEAREHPLRNQLYRTVGQQPQVMVDFIYQPVGLSSHLLLCSDGLWGLVNVLEIEQALMRSPWPQDTCNELIALANLAGGEDNISAVVVSLPMAER
ncbi:MAG: serine/threonine-protein phosphatase [Oscillochloris sp.]|nr:serine/threonine-protein phosphatase [Oscillochloris sp.]